MIPLCDSTGIYSHGSSHVDHNSGVIYCSLPLGVVRVCVRAGVCCSNGCVPQSASLFYQICLLLNLLQSSEGVDNKR